MRVFVQAAHVYMCVYTRVAHRGSAKNLCLHNSSFILLSKQKDPDSPVSSTLQACLDFPGRPPLPHSLLSTTQGTVPELKVPGLAG